MARARRPLSPDPTALLAKINPQPKPVVVDQENKDQPAADLEDGEITEEEKLEEPKAIIQAEVDASIAPSSAIADEAQEPLPVPLSEPEEPKPPPAVEIASSEPPLASPVAVEAVVSETIAPRALSEEELDLAKSIVLDLLGWGVQPEYLVECGVSSHAIYKIFTDLNLRLPMNLSYFG